MLSRLPRRPGAGRAAVTLPEVQSWRTRDGALRFGFVRRLGVRGGRRVYLVTVRDAQMSPRPIAGPREVVGVPAAQRFLRRRGAPC